MMNWMFTPQDPAVDQVIRFSKDQLKSTFAGDLTHLRGVWRAAGEFGLFRNPFPEKDGGLGAGPNRIVSMLEALGYGSDNNGLLFSFGAHMWAVIKPIIDFGSNDIKTKYLTRLLGGQLIGAHAASEFGAGSDVMAMTTRFIETEDGYLLNGAKAWVTNAPIADVFVIFATEDSRLHFRGISAFVVPRQTPGLDVRTAERKIGLHDSLMAQVILTDCQVPKQSLLGERRRGNNIFRDSLAFERGLILVPYLGVMRRQIERCIRYSNERCQFGRSIGKNDAVSHRIAGMVQRYTLSKLLAQEAATKIYAGEQARLYASLCKLTLSEAVCANSQDVLRISGAPGFMQDYHVDTDVLDSLGGLIYSGTSDIQKNIISAEVGVE
jgi:alkylation response protein AidB-like acyl-CoA dehydrogenase